MSTLYQWTALFKVPLVSYEKFFLLQLGNVVDLWLIDKYIKCHLYPDLKKRQYQNIFFYHVTKH
jgi:hypothetical protein